MPIASADMLTRRELPPPPVPPTAQPIVMNDNPPLDSDLVPTDDGGMIVVDKARPKRDSKHDDNLAEDLPDIDLMTLAADILDGIEADIRSRVDWEAAFTRGIDLLGIKMDEATSDVTSGGTVSKIYDTIMLEACIRYQSNFRAEMLPATGPVKVRDDKPTDRPHPPNPGMGHNGGPPMPGPQMGAPAAPPPPGPPPPQPGPPSAMGAQPQQPGLAAPPPPMPPPPPAFGEWPTRADLAEAFEMDFNHYLTAVDKNFYPDTDRMSFSQALHGCAFKKVYKCPIRRRPTSIFVMANDLIVSNDASSLDDAQRITHRSIMSKATMARMKHAGVYRDIELMQPQQVPLPSEMKIKEAEGVKATPERPQDQEYTIYECYVDLDLPGFEHKKGSKPTGLPMPYRVTIDKDSREILEIRRNWKEGDKDFIKRARFVKYSFIPGLGFYDYGFVHILGNTARALTAIERILIDAGMFNCFPGGLLAKVGGRQETNQIRMAPGGWKTIDTGGLPINQVVSPLPYKEPSATLMALGQAISENGRRLGMTAEVQVGEGRADVPVGTTIALIEQSTKVMSSVHKRNHTAQQEEFELLRELFIEDPKSLWSFAKSPSRKWEQSEEFGDLTLVPASDPNVPSHVHRIMQAQALVQIAQTSAGQGIFDNRKIAERVLRVMGVEDYQDLMLPPQPPTPPPPDPKAMSDAANMRLKQMDAQSKQQNAVLEGQIRMKEIEAENQNAEAERKVKMDTAHLNYAEEMIRQQAQAKRDQLKMQTDVHLAHAGHIAGILKEQAKPKPVAKSKDT